MSIKKIVVNASPLILLCKANLESLLPKLFDRIVVPVSVRDEILIGNDIASRKIEDADWIELTLIDIHEAVSVWNLGDGESEVLSFALSHTEFRASIDDRAARTCAQTLQIETLGTGGILVLAKRRGLIESIHDSLVKLKDAGLFISDGISDLLKTEAGE